MPPLSLCSIILSHALSSPLLLIITPARGTRDDFALGGGRDGVRLRRRGGGPGGRRGNNPANRYSLGDFPMFNTRTPPQSYTHNQHGRQSHIEVSKGTVFILRFFYAVSFGFFFAYSQNKIPYLTLKKIRRISRQAGESTASAAASTPPSDLLPLPNVLRRRWRVAGAGNVPFFRILAKKFREACDCGFSSRCRPGHRGSHDAKSRFEHSSFLLSPLH